MARALVEAKEELRHRQPPSLAGCESALSIALPMAFEKNRRPCLQRGRQRGTRSEPEAKRARRDMASRRPAAGVLSAVEPWRAPRLEGTTTIHGIDALSPPRWTSVSLDPLAVISAC
jgi:hypothetical protein